MATQFIFTSIMSGGAIGPADQYLCLILLSIASRSNWMQLPKEVNFISSGWFLILVGIIWIATVLPAYGSLIDPVFLRAVNTTVGLMGGILVPASGALLSLATANFISPTETATMSNSDLWLIGGGGAAVASTFTFVKFLIKPMLATATGMATTPFSAAVYKTIENIISLILMAAIYFLGSLNPWLLALLMATVGIILFALLIFALYQLWKLGQGIGKVLRLFETNPKAGFAVLLEPFIWGSGWILMKGWQSGSSKLVLWGGSLIIIWGILPIIFFIVPPLAATIPFLVSFGAIYLIGIKSSKKLLLVIEAESKITTYKSNTIDQPI